LHLPCVHALHLQRHLEAPAAAAAAVAVEVLVAAVQEAAAAAMTAPLTACGHGRWRMRCCLLVGAAQFLAVLQCLDQALLHQQAGTARVVTNELAYVLLLAVSMYQSMTG
jgi:hypothetical protein